MLTLVVGGCFRKQDAKAVRHAQVSYRGDGTMSEVANNLASAAVFHTIFYNSLVRS